MPGNGSLRRSTQCSSRPAEGAARPRRRLLRSCGGGESRGHEGRRRHSTGPTVVTSRFDHSASRRQRVTWALPGDPMRMRSSPRRLWLRRSMMVLQSLRRLTCVLRKVGSPGGSTASGSSPNEALPKPRRAAWNSGPGARRKPVSRTAAERVGSYAVGSHTNMGMSRVVRSRYWA